MLEKNKIIKALELCSDSDAPCNECPYANKEPKCMSALMSDAAMLLRTLPDKLVIKKQEENPNEQ